MSKIYLLIGSNKGNCYSFIKEAIELIHKDIIEFFLVPIFVDKISCYYNF